MIQFGYTLRFRISMPGKHRIFFKGCVFYNHLGLVLPKSQGRKGVIHLTNELLKTVFVGQPLALPGSAKDINNELEDIYIYMYVYCNYFAPCM